MTQDGRFQSHDGLQLPAVGFGTAWIKGAAGVRTLGQALDNGYTLLDSAFNYENEGAVGRAVRDSAVDRASVIVTSKLPGRPRSCDRGHGSRK